MLTLLGISFIFLSSSSEATWFRWVDETGSVFYSDQIPPIASKHGHTTLNKGGLKKTVALSALQKKAILSKKEQRIKQRLAEIVREKKRALKEEEDQQLLALYSSRKELIGLYKNKLNMSQNANVLLKKRHKIVSKRLEKIEAKYEKMKNPKFKATLATKITDMLDGLRVYQQAITENLIEQSHLKVRFNKDLKHFDSLVPRHTLSNDDTSNKVKQEVKKLAFKK